MEGIAPFGRYTVLVLAPRAADQLERLARRAAAEDNPMEDADGRYGSWANAYSPLGNHDYAGDPSPLGSPNAAARLELQTRPTDSLVSMHVPDTAVVGQPFTVKVTVENPGKKKVAKLGVRLSMPPLYDA